ncbi:MAG: hypothetical protein R2705_07805 [Ilumatobacteraceae bacterium]
MQLPAELRVGELGLVQDWSRLVVHHAGAVDDARRVLIEAQRSVDRSTVVAVARWHRDPPARRSRVPGLLRKPQAG